MHRASIVYVLEYVCLCGGRTKVIGSNEIQMTESEYLTCEHSRGVVVKEVSAEPVVAPFPPIAVPVQITNAEVAV